MPCDCTFLSLGELERRLPLGETGGRALGRPPPLGEVVPRRRRCRRRCRPPPLDGAPRVRSASPPSRSPIEHRASPRMCRAITADLVAVVLEQRERAIGERHRVRRVAGEQLLLRAERVGRRERPARRQPLERLDRLGERRPGPLDLPVDGELGADPRERLAHRDRVVARPRDRERLLVAGRATRARRAGRSAGRRSPSARAPPHVRGSPPVRARARARTSRTRPPDPPARRGRRRRRSHRIAGAEAPSTTSRSPDAPPSSAADA